MSDIIRLLPDSVANQIAAGEVIQRPASVIKELVENSVDAGADIIEIELKDAGRTLIRVKDNGSGMSPSDARMAFERHSTSKIKDASDLFHLQTMGFRGEALASIAAVSHVDLRTMRPDETMGTRLIIKGSRVESQEPEACVVGSDMMIRNIFFNVPARRKFLKKDSVELAAIMREYERLALVNTNVELSITHNDQLISKLMRAPLKQRIGDLFGASVENQLVPIEATTGLVKLSGFIGRPEGARKKGALQYFFVNGRNMRHPYFNKAINLCYEKLIAPDCSPNYFISFEVDPESIDVNIHPTKNEIKFENEQEIWQILGAAVKEALGKYNLGPSIEFNIKDAPDIPAFEPSDKSQPPRVALNGGYNPFSGGTSSNDSWRNRPQKVITDWEKLYDMFERKGHDSQNEVINGGQTSFGIDEVRVERDVSPFLQIADSYIVVPGVSGMTVINQHRAHVKVLFEDYLPKLEGEGIISQQLIFPVQVELNATQRMIYNTLLDRIEKAGFYLEKKTSSVFEIKGIPAVLKNSDGKEVLLEILEDFENETTVSDEERVLKRLALSLAHGSAIGTHQKLSQQEMEQIVSTLFAINDPKYTPDGKKILFELSVKEIENWF